MPAPSPNLALVHLVRRANGMAPFEAFMASYERHEPGCEHELVLLLKGFAGAADAAPFLQRAAAHAPRALYEPDVGLDLTVYVRAAARLAHRRLAFLNSFSEILAPGWLAMLAEPVEHGGGAAGATGSWGSSLGFRLWQASVLRTYAGVFTDRRAVRRTMHAIAGVDFRSDLRFLIGNVIDVVRDVPHELRGEALFPAMHLRTNAFVIDRELMLGLRTGRLRSKRATYRLESGRSSLTAQIRATGRRVLVVDRAGTAREAGDWHEANVFWQSRQEDLLVADNQTRSYATAPREQREVLSRFAWGPQARPWSETT